MSKRLNGFEGILFIFSLCFTAILIAAFALFLRFNSSPNVNLPEVLVNLNEQNLIASITEGGAVYPSDIISGFIPREQLGDLYLAELMKNLPYLLAVVVFIFVGSAFILSKILNLRYQKQSKALARHLVDMDVDDSNITAHPDIVRAYAKIKERLESQSTDYLRLSSYVTHEQKNILSLLRAKLELSDKPELLKDVDTAVQSLDDILTLSATEATTLEVVDAALVCAEVCDAYKKVRSTIEFEFDESDCTILSKSMWLHRAVSNLVSNAIKYTNGPIKVHVESKRGSVKIFVSDEGNGLDPKNLQRLFDYRCRIGELNANGHGIGLSLVRHVCDLSGGICLIRTSTNGGSDFIMVFPALTLD